MKKRIVACVLTSLFLCGSNAFAKEWYEKGCTATQKDREGNYYVGGPYNKNHLHVGSSFIAITSDNNNSKPVTSGKANCGLIANAIADVGGGGYTSAADATACLIAACKYYCTWNEATNTCQ